MSDEGLFSETENEKEWDGGREERSRNRSQKEKVGLGGLYGFARAAVTKCHRLGAVTNRNVSPLGPGGWQPEIQVPAGLLSSKASLLGL